MAARSHRKSPENPICSQVSGEVWASSAAGTDSPPGVQMRDSVGDVGRVPVHDRRDHQVQPRGAELLRLLAAVGDSPLLEGADHLGQCVALLAFVQARLATLPEFRRFQPVQHGRN